MSICNFYFINFPRLFWKLKHELHGKYILGVLRGQVHSIAHVHMVTQSPPPSCLRKPSSSLREAVPKEHSLPVSSSTWNLFSASTCSILLLCMNWPLTSLHISPKPSYHLFTSLTQSLQGGFTWPHSSPFPSFMWMSYSTVCRPFFCQLTCGWPELFSCSEWRNIYLGLDRIESYPITESYDNPMCMCSNYSTSHQHSLFSFILLF